MAVVRRKVRYYTPRRNNRGFWEPPKWARDIGFSSVACGPDGPDAWAIAEKWNERLDRARGGEQTQTQKAIPGSLADWFWTWRTLPEYSLKKPQTQKEHLDNWKHIEPAFGNMLIEDISADDIMLFHQKLDTEKTPRVRWGAIKNLKTILNAAVARSVLDRAPKFLLSNPAPNSRTQLFFPQELEALKAESLKQCRPELHLLIWLLWETAFSPVDGRLISLDMLRQDHEGFFISRERSKTRKTATPSISQTLYKAIQNYVTQLGFEIAPNAPILRRSSTGEPWKDSADLSKDFRRVRDVVLGKGDDRSLMDIRRTVSFCADLGGAAPEERGSLLANNIGQDGRLDETYSPTNVIKARQTSLKAQTGAEIMRQLYQKRSESG